MTIERMSDAERSELQHTARRVLAERSPMERVRELLDDPRGFDPALFAGLVDLGWTGMHLPEAMGGFGASFADTAVVISELGRAVVAGPLVSSAIVASGALLATSNTAVAKEMLPAIVDGSMIATVAIAGAGGHYSSAAVGPQWMPADGGGVVLHGAATFVLDAEVADVLIVFARGEMGIVAAVVDRNAPGVVVTPTATLDQTRRPAQVAFDRVRLQAGALLAEPTDGAA
ncbi:MAG TPA: acyl-CoA dehydrogenase family protein, partial [Ilumatobacter sp.]|nr:acyl-CoA dehydrogenase family protein [Ilumatobacter sp.]